MQHFSKVCHSAQKEGHEVVVLEVTVPYLNDAVPTKYKIFCKVQIEAPAGHTCNVELIVDTVSSVSILLE